MPRYPQPGAVLLGKYRVDSVIGEGGMGAVLQARHLDLDEPVAIKVLLPEMLQRQDIVRRFLREAKAAVKLKGEHVARVHDVGRLEEFENTPYIVMEFLEGADLNAIIKHHGAQDPQVAVDLMLHACEAIAEAHSLGIIHRDIKASNFFVIQPSGQAPSLKVLDFGIATAPEGTSDLTSTQSVIGTPAYMAPEQMRSSRQVDARSDIWSMGVVLYEMLEGARPFRSEAYSDLCLKVGMDPPEPFTQADVPEALRMIVMKCLEKTVERRYQSIAELAFDLMPFATDPVLARAVVEQCARMLGRRGHTRSFAAMRAPDDATPLPLTPPRLTPAGVQYAVPEPKTPTSGTGPVAVVSSRRTLTPVPAAPVQRTPTSINASNGEISRAVSWMDLKPKRNLAIAAGLSLAIVLGVGVWVFSRGGGSDGSTSKAAATPEPAKIEPAAIEATQVAPPAKIEPAKVEGAKVDAAKVEPAKVDRAKVDAVKVETASVDPAMDSISSVDVKKSGATKPAKPRTNVPVKVKPATKKKPDDDPYGQRQ